MPPPDRPRDPFTIAAAQGWWEEWIKVAWRYIEHLEHITKVQRDTITGKNDLIARLEAEIERLKGEKYPYSYWCLGEHLCWEVGCSEWLGDGKCNLEFIRDKPDRSKMHEEGREPPVELKEAD